MMTLLSGLKNRLDIYTAFLSFLPRLAWSSRDDHALSPGFLQNAFSTDPEQYERSTWNSLKTLRIFATAGVMLRFSLNREVYSSVGWAVTVISLVAAYAYLQVLAIFQNYRAFESALRRQTWTYRHVLVEILVVAAIYSVSRRADSDMYLLWGLPLMMAIVGLGARSVFILSYIALAALLPAALLADAFAPNGGRGVATVLLHVCLIRGFFLLAGVHLAFYAFWNISAQRAMWSALMAAVPEGLAIVAKEDMTIRWLNDVMARAYFGDRPLIGQVCHWAYKRSRECCEPCPTLTAFAGSPREEVTVSPESGIDLPDGSVQVPPRLAWRRYDTFCAPFRVHGETVAALECVKDTTCRLVIHEATSRLQAATDYSQVFAVAADAIQGLGYHRCRIYLLTDEGGFEGRFALGMSNMDFASVRIPRLGEPFSGQTIASMKPQVLPPSGEDPYQELLGKPPDMPWIDVPLRVGDSIYGKISIDNKTHPLRHRYVLEKEFACQNNLSRCEEMVALHELGVVIALALKHLRAQVDMSNLLRSYVHSSIGSSWLYESIAYVLLNKDKKHSDDERLRAYTDAVSLADVQKAWGSVVLRWGEILEQMEPRMELEPQELNIGECIRELVTRCSYKIRASGCKVEVDCPAIRALIDKGLFEQVVFVLLVNSLKAAQRDPSACSLGQVNISVTKIENRVTVTVVDNGIGIPADRLDSLFAAGKPVPSRGGLGLGLFVARTLARMHGGNVVLEENSPGTRVAFSASLVEGISRRL